LKSFAHVFRIGIITIGVKFFSLIFINRIITQTTGISDYYLVGNFQNLLQIITTIGLIGSGSGIIKLIGEKKIRRKTYALLNETSGLVLAVSIFVGVGLIVLRNEIGVLVFQKTDYGISILSLGMILPFIVLNRSFASFFAGRGLNNSLGVSEVTLNLITLLSVSLVARTNDLNAIFIAITSSQGLNIVISYFLITKNKIRLRIKISKPTWVLNKVWPYSIMTIITTLITPVFFILIRNILPDNYSSIWEATNKLGSIYLFFLLYPMTNYYLPQISKEQRFAKIHKIFVRVILFQSIILLVVGLTLYFFKDFVISMVFGKNFPIPKEALIYQMIGDFIKVLIWGVSFIFIAKTKLWYFLISELSLIITYYLIVLNFEEVEFIAHKSYIYSSTLCLIISLILYFKMRKNENRSTNSLF
jgi:O-antigen/teichoic acid export membrane protein